MRKQIAVGKKRHEELRNMKCPKCGKELIKSDYEGIRIERCSGCHGMWLGAGKLETILRLRKRTVDELLRTPMF